MTSALRIPSNDTLVTYDSLWESQVISNDWSSDGQWYQSNANGAQFLIPFRGNGISIYGNSDSEIGGFLRIELDGEEGPTIDLRTSQYAAGAQPIYTIDGLQDTDHQLVGTVVNSDVTADQWISGQGETSSGWVWIDWIELRRDQPGSFLPVDSSINATSVPFDSLIVDQLVASVTFGSIGLGIGEDFGLGYGGSVTYVNETGAYARFIFKGTAVWWFGAHGPDAAPVDITLRLLSNLSSPPTTEVPSTPFSSSRDDRTTRDFPTDGTFSSPPSTSVEVITSTEIVTRTSVRSVVTTVTETLATTADPSPSEVVLNFQAQAYSDVQWFQKIAWGMEGLELGDWELTLRHAGQSGQILSVDFFRILPTVSFPIATATAEPSEAMPLFPNGVGLVLSSAVGGLVLLALLSICGLMKFMWRDRNVPRKAQEDKFGRVTAWTYNVRNGSGTVTAVEKK